MKRLGKTVLHIAAFSAGAAFCAFTAERINEIKTWGKEIRHKPYGTYERFVKRPLDCFLSTGALVVLSPLLALLSAVGAYEMKGSPFFVQARPGREERIFRLVKFRSMSDKRDENGELLPDIERLGAYGRFIRKTSLDELPELLNIAKGDMALVGPRPLAVQYLPYYNEKEQHRHDVRPGLTGLAQINGRNAVGWEKRFAFDTDYVSRITFLGDLKIILSTVTKVFRSENIEVRGTGSNIDFDEFRRQQLTEEEKC